MRIQLRQILRSTRLFSTLRRAYKSVYVIFNMNDEAKARVIASGGQQRAGDASTGSKEVAQQVTKAIYVIEWKLTSSTFFLCHVT